MIPDCYLEEPFIVNIESEYLMDFYLSKFPEEQQSIMNTLLNESPEYANTLYYKMIEIFARENINSGIFGLVPIGYKFLKDVFKKGSPLNITAKELNMDFTHLKGLSRLEARIILIPFTNMDDLEYFSYIGRKDHHMMYWKNGEFVGSNTKFIKFV